MPRHGLSALEVREVNDGLPVIARGLDVDCVITVILSSAKKGENRSFENSKPSGLPSVMGDHGLGLGGFGDGSALQCNEPRADGQLAVLVDVDARR